MKWLACASAIGLFVVGAAFQDSLPALLQTHLKTLREANSLTATVAVTEVGGTPVEYKLAYAKPNFLKVTGPDGFSLTDGKNVYSYSAKEKSYTEAPLTDASFKTAFAKEFWGWSAFFAKEDKEFAKAGKAGVVRRMKGVEVTEVMVTPTQENIGQVTLYFDPKLGMARGYNLKTPEKDLVVMASELKVSTDPLPESEFAFVAPAGATKVDPNAAPKVTFAMVQDMMDKNCLPCHSATQKAAGITTTSHEGLLAILTPGQPAESRLVKSLRGVGGVKKMPKNRAAMPEAQIKLVEAWIADGAKAQ